MIVAIVLTLSGSVAHAARRDDESKPASPAATNKFRQITLDSFLRDNVDEKGIASLRGRTPVGHRQPRISDIPAMTQLSPLELELRREDEVIDKKLTICRGC